jgi:hypothetical protein
LQLFNYSKVELDPALGARAGAKTNSFGSASYEFDFCKLFSLKSNKELLKIFIQGHLVLTYINRHRRYAWFFFIIQVFKFQQMRDPVG